MGFAYGWDAFGFSGRWAFAFGGKFATPGFVSLWRYEGERWQLWLDEDVAILFIVGRLGVFDVRLHERVERWLLVGRAPGFVEVGALSGFGEAGFFKVAEVGEGRVELVLERAM